MEKYRDIDEDELLKKLSEEELQRLEDELEELDPDVSLQYKFHIEAFLSLCWCLWRVMWSYGLNRATWCNILQHTVYCYSYMCMCFSELNTLMTKWL